MRRIERLYAISERLRQAAPATVAARVLADELGVTRRTIERDLAALRLAGAPVHGQPGRRGGSGSVATARRVVVTLDHTELVGLLVAAHLSRDAPYAGAAATAVSKLAAVLDPGERRAVDQLRGRFRVAAPEPVRVRPRVRSVLEDGVHAQTVVRLHYVDRNGAASSRRVEPVGFYAADGWWALVAWCQWRDAGRLFYLHRIQRAHATSVWFAPRDLDDVLGWVPTPGHRP